VKDLEHNTSSIAGNAMAHIAIQESLDGNNADWLEKVGDAQYRK
jgi:hypothetical protein